MSKVFLGGTCGKSTWREQLIPFLKIDYFNPVVDDWTEEMIEIEEDEKQNKCDIHLYVITKDMEGVYSIAEAVESCFNPDKTTIFFVIKKGFDKGMLKSLRATEQLILRNGGIIKSPGEVQTIKDLADFLNEFE